MTTSEIIWRAVDIFSISLMIGGIYFFIQGLITHRKNMNYYKIKDWYLNRQLRKAKDKLQKAEQSLKLFYELHPHLTPKIKF
jgi:hypothetical protein